MNTQSIRNCYKLMKLKDCITKVTTGLNPRDNFVLGSGTKKYITAKNLNRQGTIDFSTCDYMNDEAKTIVNKRSGIRQGNILFSSRAPIGSCHLITENPNFYDIGESIFCLTVNEDIVSPEYLCLYLTSDFFVRMSAKQVTGSVIKEIRIGDLMDLFVIVPERTTQLAIVNPIKSIDDKIALNKSICSNLKALAKEIYDYWFVQFDFPDDNGRPYKSSGGKMVWNKKLKREIPEGWKVSTLKGKYSIERGLSYTSKEIESGNGVAMINLACVDRNRNYRDGELKYYDGKITDNDYIYPNNLLIACTDLTRDRDIIGCPILAPDDGVNYTYSMDIAKISFDDDLDDMYMYMTLRTTFYHNYIKKWASGTNVLHLDLEGLDWYPIAIPPKALQEKISSIVVDIHTQASHKMAENRNLAKLRDYLLPMLINGQIKAEQKNKP